MCGTSNHKSFRICTYIRKVECPDSDHPLILITGSLSQHRKIKVSFFGTELVCTVLALRNSMSLTLAPELRESGD